MNKTAEWRIEYFETSAGRQPVEEFILKLPEKTQAKIAWSLDLLEKHGLSMGEPYVKTLKGCGKLRELRVRHGRNFYRIFFVPFQGQSFILLHAFKKKTSKTPKREIETAIKRMTELS